MRSMTITVLTLTLLSAGALAGQTAARDPSDRLREVLPPDVADRVLATIAAARARELPAAALEHRALKFAARGVDPSAIERSVAEHADRMSSAQQAFEAARGRGSRADELEAGAEVLRKGLSGSDLSDLAKAAPSGRSLAVPLYALGALLDRGLPADDAIQRVHDRLAASAADAEFQNMAAEPNPAAAAGQAHRPAVTGTDLATTKRPETTPVGRGGAAGPPATIPANAGKDVRPTKPTTPPGRGRGGQ